MASQRVHQANCVVRAGELEVNSNVTVVISTSEEQRLSSASGSYLDAHSLSIWTPGSATVNVPAIAGWPPAHPMSGITSEAAHNQSSLQ